MADNRDLRMKPGPWKSLLDRAHAVGIDTMGYDSRSTSADLLRERVVAAEQRTGKVYQPTKTRVRMADIPSMSACSAGQEQLAREWVHYMLSYINYLEGGNEPAEPQDILTNSQRKAARDIAGRFSRTERVD